MFDYLQKFNALPKDLRDKISSPAVMAAISALESKYGVDLAMTVMRVMIKTLSLENLPFHLASEFGLNQTQAESLNRDLKDQVFLVVATYLGLNSDSSALDLNQNLERIVKESGIRFTSTDALARFKQILNTYLRGVRTKIDTRNSLAKSVVSGGLNLDTFTIDKVFKICDELTKALPAPEIVKPSASPALDRLIVADAVKDKTAITHESEYNLKDLAAKGKLKPLGNLDTSHELPSGEMKDLPAPPSIDAEAAAIADLASAKITEALSKINPVPSTPSPELAPKVEAPAPAATLRQEAAPKPLVKSPLPAAANLRPAADPSRPKVADIRPMPKIMGPIEELQFLDLVNFRRLGVNPSDITSKIYTKIRLLEKTGYDQMIQGVVAWRKGIINRVYLKMCQEAFAKGMPLKEIIAKRQSENREYLTWDEINAIVDLNKKLMF
ncbi:MAG: hypothetical protein WC441_00425 [Patescibacteria group bacterium]